MAAVLAELGGNDAAVLRDRVLQVREQHETAGYKPRLSYDTLQVIAFCGTLRSSTIMCFAPSTGAMVSLGELPISVSAASIAVVGQRDLYVCGGQAGLNARPTDKVFLYISAQNGWQEMQPMQTARAEAGIGVVDGFVFVVGGVGISANGMGLTELDSVERFDPIHNEWNYVSSLPVAQTSCAVAVHSRQLFVFGGQLTSSVLLYDVAANAWSEVAGLASPRIGCSVCAGSSGLIYVMGGTDSRARLVAGEIYDPLQKKSVRGFAVSPLRTRGAIARVGTRLYMLGGQSTARHGPGTEIQWCEETDIDIGWTLHDSHIPADRCDGLQCSALILSNGCAVLLPK
ncbi:kelch-like protein diablo [Paramacrobiotus metropolitanus]|uniref:kelch-like protein diablo n=1 Tax=Paramacrobiotus metropolitanus TaxID=2943436 RepID=UPI0024459354|nr:kelch-like protein diablo [Paramacrobiotus metropolitanus]